MTSDKVIIATGKKKNATARVRISKGKGSVKINSVPLDKWGSYIERSVVNEPLMLSGNLVKEVQIEVNVNGGGLMGQAAASRIAIARALVKWSKDSTLRKRLIEYDDKIISGDPRRKEPCKPNDSAPRAKRQKSYR